MRNPEEIVLQKGEVFKNPENLSKLFHSAFNNISEAIAIIEGEQILLCNNAFKALFGFKLSEESASRSILELISIDYINDFNTKLKDLVQDKNSTSHFDVKCLRCNSIEFDSEVILKLEFVSGKPVIFATFHDITEKKSLQDQINKLSYVLDKSSSVIIITNPSGIVEYTNPKFTDVTGFFFEEVFGKQVNIFGDEDVTEVQANEVWYNIRNGHSWRGEVRNRRKNGEYYWESVFISPIMNENGDLNHILFMKDDLSFKKEMELELKRALDCAEEANKLKFNLLSNMSHELRTPLTGIIGFSSLLRDELSETDHVEITDKILKSSKRLLVTLNSVLNLAEIESGNYPISLTEFNLGTYTRYFLTNYDKTASEKNLSFEINIQDDEINAVGDENLFKQILMHIVDNAIKFTNTGGIRIEVTSGEDDQGSTSAIVKVIDTGIGINIEDQSKIFREFRQLSEGIRRNFEGSGLGLSVAKKMIKLMKGNILVESIVNNGSTFSIVLPGTKKSQFESDLTIAVKPPKNIEFRRTPVSPKISTPGKKLPYILSIEDNLLNSELVNLFLKNLFKVDSANSYAQALEKLRLNKYDALLIDINLGNGPSGIDVAKAIRNMPGYEFTPLVALTGYALLKDEKYLLQEGFNYYLHKPFDREDLINTLNKALKLK
ncbi:MAG TPA: ATP-binding protein [Melioribacteraceae bacterium]|nr:ATP-binding protein [Melioribacteraceae bacterium]